MKALAIIASAVLALGFGAGWLTARVPETDELARDRDLLSAYNVRHGGEAPSAARAEFERLHPPPAPPQVEAPAAAPPPPDIAVIFRRNLTAIERGPGGPSVLVVDINGDTSRRRLRPGQLYQDGWTVASIRDQTIVLRRRRETRTVQVFDPPEYETQ